MVEILYTVIEKEELLSFWESYSPVLSPDEAESIGRFRRIEDRCNRLAARVLVGEMLRELGLSEALVREVVRDEYGRPSIAGCVDFNISHSGAVTILAYSPRGRVGIDVEEVAPIEMDDFCDQFSEAEWRSIREAEEPLRMFYHLWTGKESIIKAEGRGLSIELGNLNRSIDVERWVTRVVEIDSRFVCHVTCEQGVEVSVSRRVETACDRARTAHHTA